MISVYRLPSPSCSAAMPHSESPRCTVYSRYEDSGSLSGGVSGAGSEGVCVSAGSFSCIPGWISVLFSPFISMISVYRLPSPSCSAAMLHSESPRCTVYSRYEDSGSLSGGVSGAGSDESVSSPSIQSSYRSQISGFSCPSAHEPAPFKLYFCTRSSFAS